MVDLSAKDKTRIGKAWKVCKDWITDFAGTPVQSYLTEVSMETFANAFGSIRTQTKNYRVSVFHKGDDHPVQYIPPEALYEHILGLERNELDGIDIDFTVPFSLFDLDFHLVVYSLGKRKLELELVWWNDQVFTDDSDEAGDSYLRFEAILGYLINLQESLQSDHLLLGPEIFEHPGPETEAWIEV